MLLEARFSVLKDFIQFSPGNIPTLRVPQTEPSWFCSHPGNIGSFLHMHSAASKNNSRVD